MAQYRYKALTTSGSTIRGMVEARSENVAARKLRDRNLYPLALQSHEGPASAIRNPIKMFLSPSSTQNMTVATEELAALVQSGIELDRALGIVSDMSSIGTFGSTFTSIRHRIRGGASLADSFAKHPCFPKYYIGLVRAGEYGGNLGSALQRLADYLRRNRAIRETVLSAMIYPTILLITAGVSVGIIVFYVLPEFEPLFSDTGKTLPLPTQIVMGIARFCRTYWWLIALDTISAAAWIRIWAREHRLRAHTMLLRLPIIGALMSEIEIERFIRCLGTLLSTGLPLPDALQLSGGVLWNTAIAANVQNVFTGVREGKRLADCLSRSAHFPATAVDVIRIGEETGRLDEMLLRQAELNARHIKQRIERAIALLVPTLTILLGIVIAGLIASMLVAILSINDLALG